MFQYLPQGDTLFCGRRKNVMKYKHPLILTFHPDSRHHAAQLGSRLLLARRDACTCVRFCVCVSRAYAHHVRASRFLAMREQFTL